MHKQGVSGTKIGSLSTVKRYEEAYIQSKESHTEAQAKRWFASRLRANSGTDDEDDTDSQSQASGTSDTSDTSHNHKHPMQQRR